MGGIGPMEVIVVLVIALMVLGPKKLPEAGKSLGNGIREFKASLSSDPETKAELLEARQNRKEEKLAEQN